MYFLARPGEGSLGSEQAVANAPWSAVDPSRCARVFAGVTVGVAEFEIKGVTCGMRDEGRYAGSGRGYMHITA